MIVTCPACRKHYRIDPGRLGEGRRLRCKGCGRVFEAGAAGGAPPSARPAPAPADRPAPEMEAPKGDPRPSAPPAAGNAPESPLVLIADEDPGSRALAGRILSGLGCRVEMTADGRSAFQFAVSRHPALMILNTRLKGLSGEAVCGGVKGSPHLAGIRVVLLGDVTAPDCRPDEVLDPSLEEGQMRARLAAVLGRGAASRPGAAAPAGAAPRPGGSPPDGGRSAPASPGDEIRRLARVMVSELKLYNPERFATAMRDGRFLEAFRPELMRGRDLLAARFADLPDRAGLLAAALREAIEAERGARGGRAAG